MFFVPASVVNENGEVLSEVSGVWVWDEEFRDEGDGPDFFQIDVAASVNYPAGSDESSLVFRSINDNGVIAGMIDSDQVGGTPDTIVLIFPHDADNNGHPDFREIGLGDRADTDGNLIPDDIEGMRVGMYATGLDPSEQFSDDVNNIKAVRVHSGYVNLRALADDTHMEHLNQCDDHEETFTVLGGTGGTAADPKEIIYMVRNQRFSANSAQDYIPTGADKTEKLSDLFCFVYKYAEWIDYIQFGNEIFGGPGEYWIDDGMGGYAISDALEADFEQACIDVFAWMDEQVLVARQASALAGRPIRIISPSMTLGQVAKASTGDLSNPCFLHETENGWTSQCASDRAAFAADCVTDFANRHGAWADLHLHYTTTTEFDDAVDDFTAPGLNQWTAPELVTCMEWSPIPTQTWVQTNMSVYEDYFSNLQQPNDDWDSFVEDWSISVFGGDPPLGSDLTTLNSEGFLHACYGGFRQQPLNGDPDQFHLINVRANEVHRDLDWLTNWDTTQLTTYIVGELESAAASYSMTWDFHADTISIDCGCD